MSLKEGLDGRLVVNAEIVILTSWRWNVLIVVHRGGHHGRRCKSLSCWTVRTVR